MWSVIVSALFVLGVSSAQSQGSVKNKMEKHEVVPDVVDQAPAARVEVKYGNLDVTLGNELTPTQAQNPPTVNWIVEDEVLYTLLMTDPDAPSRSNPKFREWHHWLVGNIPGSSLSDGEVLSEYIGSGPPKDTGLHRYVFLVFKQPGKIQFDEPRLPSTSTKNRGKFSTRDFASKYNLELVAGNLFQAQYDSYVDKLYQQFKD